MHLPIPPNPQQTLKELIPQKSTADLALLLQPWAYQFKKLLLDPSKAVRAEAATIMAAVGSSVGKALLPQLKGVLGPWYLACFDPYPDAADAAKRSLQDVFPAKKQDDALVYCRCEALLAAVGLLQRSQACLGVFTLLPLHDEAGGLAICSNRTAAMSAAVVRPSVPLFDLRCSLCAVWLSLPCL